MGLVEEHPEVVDRARFGVHREVVADVVAAVTQRRRVEGQQPQAVDPQPLQVVELGDEPGEVPHPVVVPVEEPADEDLVEHGPLEPQRVLSRGRERAGRARAGRRSSAHAIRRVRGRAPGAVTPRAAAPPAAGPPPRRGRPVPVRHVGHHPGEPVGGQQPSSRCSTRASRIWWNSRASRSRRNRSRSPVAIRWARCSAIAVHSVVHPVARRRHRVHDRRPPVAQLGEVEHQLEVPPGLAGTGPVGLVDDEQVGDLQQARPCWPGWRRPSPGSPPRRWCRWPRPRRPPAGRRRPSRAAPPARPRPRAPARRRARPRPVPRGGRGWPSTG